LQNLPSIPTGHEQSKSGRPLSSQSFTWYEAAPRTSAFTLDSATLRLPTRPLAA